MTTDPRFPVTGPRLAVAAEQRLRSWIETVPRRFSRFVSPDPTVASWANDMALGATRGGLTLMGPTGTGKTHQAWSACVALAGTGGPLALAANTPDLLAACRPGGDPGALEAARTADLLFLDDLAVGKASDWTEEVLYRILNHRYDHELPTLVTTNLPPDGLSAALGARLVSRLTGMTTQVVLSGPDRRRVRP